MEIREKKRGKAQKIVGEVREENWREEKRRKKHKNSREDKRREEEKNTK